MQIAIRMDDITPDMDWERFIAFKAVLDEYGVKPLLGVIPDNQDENLKKSHKMQADHPEFWSYMLELQKQGWILAMHGCHHVYSTKKGGMFPLNNFSEFAGLPYDAQKKMITEGKQILEEKGIITDIFMAPGHSYDQKTLSALKEAGFFRITDGFGDAPYQWKGLVFYPISFKLSNSLRKNRGFTTMVIHAGTMTDDDIERVRGNLSKDANTNWISFKEYLDAPVGKRSVLGRLWEYVLAKTKYYLVKLK